MNGNRVNYINFKNLIRDKSFYIPSNQRHYSWEKVHIRQFWNDIHNFSDIEDYFMSSIIIQEDKSRESYITCNLETIDNYLIIDGQQRIISIIILIKCICNFIINKDYITYIIHNYISTNLNEYCDVDNIFRLNLNEDLNDYFINLLTDRDEGRADMISKERLKNTFIFFHSMLKIKSKEYKDNINEFQVYLRKLYMILTEKLYFSVYFADKNTNIGILFESSNCRGRTLTNLEKIKNKFILISNIVKNKELEDQINNTWSFIYRTLTLSGLGKTSNEDQFLHFLWQSMNESLVGSKDKLYDELTSEFNNKKNDVIVKVIENYLKILVPALITYCDIYNPFDKDSFDTTPELKNELIDSCIKLHRLRILDIFAPLLISISIVGKNRGKNLLEIMKFAEIYVMRVYRIAEKKSNTGKNFIFRMSGKIYHGNASINDIKILLQQFIKMYCPLPTLKRFFDSKRRNFYEFDFTKYILIEYDIYLQKLDIDQKNKSNNNNNNNNYQITEGVLRHSGTCVIIPIEPEDVTIEHILPREFNGCIYWIEQFGSANICSKYVNMLGNLTLTKKNWNSSYGNKSYIEKRDSSPYGYNKSEYMVEREVSEYENWNSYSICERQKKISEWAEIRWNYI